MRLLVSFVKAFLRVFSTSKVKGHDRNASFGTPFPYVRYFNRGLTITGTKRIPRLNSFQNLLVIGATGTGKSSCCLIPSILKQNDASLIIHDPSGELYDHTAGRLMELGYRVHIFNPAKPNISDSFNVLAYCRTETDLHRLARTLIQTSNATSSGEPIWEELATSLISIILRGLFHKDKVYHSLANVYHVLHHVASDPKGLIGFFRDTGNPKLLSEYEAFISYDEKLRTGVIATATGALHYLSDDGISRITSSDTLNLYKIREQKTAIYVQNKIGEGPYYRSLSSLFFETLFSILFSHRPQTGEHDVFLLLDEASSITCPTLPLAIANLRKYRVGIALVLQEYAQLVSLCGSHGAETIRTNCLNRLYFGGGSLSQCQELEAVLGMYTYIDSLGMKRERPLLTSDEIRMLPPSKALFISGFSKPLLLSLTPFYKQIFMRWHTKKKRLKRQAHPKEPTLYPL